MATKKTFIILLIATTIVISALFCWPKPKPIITVVPEKAMIDELVEITISNLAPHEYVTLEISSKDKFGKGDVWKSSATFQANDQGIVNVAKQEPISGSYKGIEPMGLFWSMTATDKDPYKKTKEVQDTLNLEGVLLSVFSQDQLRAQKGIHRAWPDIEKKEIREQGVIGELFYPKDRQANPSIITIPGAGRFLDVCIAQILASHGYTVLALAYFGYPGLPEKLSLIPLEYFENAIRWLQKQPQVNGNKVALVGQSTGAEVVLLMASLFPDEVDAAIVYSPSHLIHGDNSSPHEKSAWTLKNKPLPFMPFPSYEQGQLAVKEGQVKFHEGTIEDPIPWTPYYLYALKKFSGSVKAATIPVEHIRCPLLIFSGNDDEQWPSFVAGQKIIERLDFMGSKIKRNYINFPHAGNHLFTFPYRSSIDLPFSTDPKWTIAGGTPEGNAHAIEQAWKETLNFLKETLQN